MVTKDESRSFLTVEYEYWESHYRFDGSSGEGSIGKNREWKWSVINSYVGNFDNVVDIGCGDLSFWEGRELSENFSYFGIDISPTIVMRNQKRYPTWRFYVGDASVQVPDIKGRVVFCLDMLFHIMDDERYVRILENLARYSLEWIFVFTWFKNPFNLRYRLMYLKHVAWTRIVWSHKMRGRQPMLIWNAIKPARLCQDVKFLVRPTESDGVYEKYRRLEDHIDTLENHGFTLVGKHQSPYSEAGAMYVFRLQSTPVALAKQC